MASKTSKEKFNEEVWYVLQKIKKLSLKVSSDTPIEYEIKKITASGIPSAKSQSQIIEKLQERKAIGIVEHIKTDSRHNNPERFLIEILEPKFSKTYKKYDPDNTTLTLDQKVAQSETRETVEILIADLESKYNEILETKAEDKFYIKLANYGKLLIENELLSGLLSKLHQNAEEDLKKYKSEREKFLKKLKILAKDIRKKAKKANIKDHPENPLISQVQHLKEGLKDTEYSHFNNKGVDYFYGPYRELIERFVRKGKTDLIKEKHLEKDGKTPKLYSDYISVQSEWKKLKKVTDSSVWWAHYNITRIAVGLLDLEDKEKYFPNDDNVSDIYKDDFDSLIKGGKVHYLEKEKAETWLKRLHEHIKPKLNIYPVLFQVTKDYGDTLFKTGKELTKYISSARLAVTGAKEVNKIIKNITQQTARIFNLPVEIAEKVQKDLSSHISLINNWEPPYSSSSSHKTMLADLDLRNFEPPSNHQNKLLKEILNELRKQNEVNVSEGKGRLKVGNSYLLELDDQIANRDKIKKKNKPPMPSFAKDEKIIVQGEKWVITKGPSRNQVRIFLLSAPKAGFITPSKKSRWVKVFKAYLENNLRLNIKEILYVWNSAKKGGWMVNIKMKKKEDVPGIHNQINKAIKKKFPVELNFDRQKTNAGVFYTLKTKEV